MFICRPPGGQGITPARHPPPMSRPPLGRRTSMTTGTIDPRYGNASATPPTWAHTERLLIEAQLHWIITVRAGGAPPAVPLRGVWQVGVFAFCTGAEEQKQRNLGGNPLVAVTTGS